MFFFALLFKAFPEDNDVAEVSNEGQNSADNTPFERYYYNRRQMSKIVEKWLMRKHKLSIIQKKFKKFKHLKQDEIWRDETQLAAPDWSQGLEGKAGYAAIAI